MVVQLVRLIREQAFLLGLKISLLLSVMYFHFVTKRKAIIY
jgi:hypothetical protein